jgi:hypothetical protein
MSDSLIPVERIEKIILFVRNQKVILDSDLADLYGVSTSRLNEQVKRNPNRFPDDFAFRLTQQEFQDLMSQFATSSSPWGGRRKLPLVFTEHGVVMAANVLNSPTAVAASIQVLRAFVRIREILSTHKDLARKLDALEKKYDENFRIVFEAIGQLMAPPSAPEKKRKFGFAREDLPCRHWLPSCEGNWKTSCVEARDLAEAAARSSLAKRAVDAAERFPHFHAAHQERKPGHTG